MPFRSPSEIIPGQYVKLDRDDSVCISYNSLFISHRAITRYTYTNPPIASLNKQQAVSVAQHCTEGTEESHAKTSVMASGFKGEIRNLRHPSPTEYQVKTRQSFSTGTGEKQDTYRTNRLGIAQSV